MAAKLIKFHRMGDRYYQGFRVAVSLEKYRDLECLIEHLNKKSAFVDLTVLPQVQIM